MNAAILLTLIGAHIPLAVQIVAERRLSQVRRLRAVRVIWSQS